MKAEAQASVVVRSGEKLELILELKVRAKTCVEDLAKSAALGIIVRSCRVNQARNTDLTRYSPRHREKAFVQVRLKAFQQRVVLVGVQEPLRPFRFLQLRRPFVLQTTEPFECTCPQ